jgi:hypothetical protein
MTYLITIFSLVLGVVGICIGIYTFRKYTNIVHSLEPVSFIYILKLSALMGTSGCFIFFALIALLGKIAERGSNWSLKGILGLLSISLVFGLLGFLGSLYQIYTTVKYRDLLIDKKIIKKKD